MSLSDSYSTIQIASKLIQECGFEDVTMAQIAREAGITEAELFTHFGSKQDIILAIYQSINADWQLAVDGIGADKLSARFEEAMIAKLDIMAPYITLLSAVMGLLLQPSRIGVQSPRTSHIRAAGMHTIKAIIDGAGDSKGLIKKVPNLPSLLYTVHWALLFLYIHTGSRDKAVAALRIVGKVLRKAGSMSQLLTLFPFAIELGDWADTLLDQPGDANRVDREILKIIFNKRKTIGADKACLDNACATCFGLHENKVSYFTAQQKPVQFILPAFPAKSPNMAKVLGKLPDLGEEIALNTLEDICREIQSVYPPGAHLTICSDGRIFSELVGVSDDDVSRYVAGIQSIIDRAHLKYISIVNLEDLLPGDSFDALRAQVLDTYSEPLEQLHERLKTSTAFKALFNGMHRFITEDRKASVPGLSATKQKQEAAAIALKVIQHSNAWTRFLTYVYPDAIRLSIHPYPAHSEKIGIQLTKADDNWLTPWHGVIVLQESGYVLMKKSEAEALGARLIFKDGKPYYYTLIRE